VYGVPLMRPHGHPIAELILTVLSQSTNDRNRDVAYLRLRERLPSWEAVMRAPVAEVEEAIRPGGISKVKSARIQAILRAIAADPRDPPHELSLDWLPQAPIDEARNYLIALPGVGRKTAACVLLFAYGMREVPVDTHVSRVSIRLGLLRSGAPFGELHDEMLALTPPGQELELHVNLLRHGRRTCHARSPACG
jgi:endonuclease-3